MASPRKGWSLFFRGDKKRWVVSRPGGKQKLLPKELKNRREALAWATKWLTENGYLEIDGTAKQPDDVELFEALCNRWVEYREKLRGKSFESATVSNNRSHIRRSIIPALGKRKVSEITPRVLADFIRGLTCAPNSTRNVYRTLVVMFDECIEQGFCDLELNPARASMVAKSIPDALTKTQEAQADTRISIDECQRICSDPRVRLERRVRYMCALTMVARDGEVMGLSRGAIDLDASIVRIVQSAKIRRYADDPSVGKPKTVKSRRALPLHSAARAALIDWFAAQDEANGSPLGPETPVFPGRDGKSFTRVSSARLFRYDLQRIGIRTTVAGCNLQFHHLRHTALNLLREAKVESEVRDYLAGHSPKSVGEGSYQHRGIESLRADVEKIAITWAGVQGSFSAQICASVTNSENVEVQ